MDEPDDANPYSNKPQIPGERHSLSKLSEELDNYYLGHKQERLRKYANTYPKMKVQIFQSTHLKHDGNCNDTNKKVVIRHSTENIHFIGLSSIELIEDLSFEQKIEQRGSALKLRWIV